MDDIVDKILSLPKEEITKMIEESFERQGYKKKENYNEDESTNDGVLRLLDHNGKEIEFKTADEFLSYVFGNIIKPPTTSTRAPKPEKLKKQSKKDDDFTM